MKLTVKPLFVDMVTKQKRNIMKKIILTIASVILIITGVSAQKGAEQKRTPEERADRALTRMKSDLALSEDQVSKLRPIVLKREQKKDELLVKMDTLKSSTRKIMKEAEEGFKKILTSEQMEKLKLQRKEMHERRMHHSGNANEPVQKE